MKSKEDLIKKFLVIVSILFFSFGTLVVSITAADCSPDDCDDETVDYNNEDYLRKCLCWSDEFIEEYQKWSMDSSELFTYVFDVVFPVGIVVGIIAIALAGYSYMNSQGQPDKVRESSEKLTSAIIGVIFVVLALWILKMIINLFIDPGVS